MTGRRFELRLLMVAMASMGIFSAETWAYNKSWDQGHQATIPQGGDSGFDPNDERHGKSTAKECCGEGDCTLCPVYANTGRLHQPFVDLRVPGVGPSLAILRTYQSQDWATSLLGRGWVFNFGRALIVGRDKDGAKIIVVRREGGEKNFFREDPNGTLTRLAKYGVPYSLVKNTDGTYAVAHKDGSVQHISADGKPLRIIDKNANQLTFEYNAVGCLSRITNASGNTVDFQLGPNGKIAGLSDNLGRSVSYAYDPNGNLASSTDPMGSSTQYFYDSKNRLTRITDPRGNVVLAATYDGFQPSRVATFTEKGETWTIAYHDGYTVKTDSLGHAWTYAFSDLGVIDRIMDPLGQVRQKLTNRVTATSLEWEQDANGHRTAYTYDSEGNVAGRTDPLGNTWQYTYAAGTDRLQTETDPLGVVTQYEYDTGGNRIQVIRDFGGPLQNTTATTYDAAGNPTRVTDPLGHTTTYEYDAYGNLIGTTDPLRHATTYTVDRWGNRVAETDALGNTTTYAYDRMNRLLSVTDPLGNTRAYAYDGNGNRVSQTDAKGAATTHAYDAWNRLTKVTDPLGNAVSTTYDPMDNRTSVKDGNGHTTTYSYDLLNRLTRETDAMGGETLTTYDGVGNILAQTDAGGQTTHYGYDAMNRRIRQTNPDGEVTSTVFDALGRIAETTLPNGNVVHHVYDRMGRIMMVEDGSGVTVTREYDLTGNLLKQKRGQTETTTFYYDAAGNVVRQTDAAGRSVTFSFDAVGHLVQTADSDGRASWRAFDAAGRLTSTTDPKGNTTQSVLDGVGNQIEVVYPSGAKTRFEYDAANRRTKRIDPDGTSVQWTYDRAGHVATKTDQSGRQVQVAYDALDRRTQETWVASDRTSRFAYDAMGRLVGLSNASSNATFRYSPGGRLQQAIQDGLTILYDDDVADSAREIVYPGGLRVRERRTPQGLISRIELVGTGIQIDTVREDPDRITETSYSTGLQILYGRDDTGLVTSVRHRAGGSDVLACRVSHDAMGIKRTREDLLDPAKSEEYQVDPTFYLTDRHVGVLTGGRVSSPEQSESFEYDAMGNITRYRSDGIDEARMYNARNELVSLASTTVSHDDAGNLTDDGQKVYAYDEDGQLLRVTRKSDGQILMQCEYDALGRRVKKIAHVPTYSEAHMIYDGLSFRVLVEVDSALAVTKRYVWGADLSGTEDEAGGAGGLLILEDITNDTRYACGYDETGNVVSLYDLSRANARAASYSYSAFGVTTQSQGPAAEVDPFRFSTKYDDAEAGLLYYGYRYYCPRLGRWMTPDPIAEMGGANLYAFAFNSPTNAVDRLGLEARKLHCVAANVGLPAGWHKTLKYGPIWSEVGVSTQFTGELCEVCCANGMKAADVALAVSGTGTLKVVGTSWGGKVGLLDNEVEAWLGVKGELSGSGGMEGSLASNNCEGRPLQGSLCFKAKAGGRLAVGGAIIMDGWLVGRTRTGTYGALSGSFSVENCMDCFGWPVHCQWQDWKICANASASVHPIMPWGEWVWTFWRAKTCHRF